MNDDTMFWYCREKKKKKINLHPPSYVRQNRHQHDVGRLMEEKEDCGRAGVVGESESAGTEPPAPSVQQCRRGPGGSCSLSLGFSGVPVLPGFVDSLDTTITKWN